MDHLKGYVWITGPKACKRYCPLTRSPLDLTPGSELFKLGNVAHESLGRTVIRMPIDEHGNFLEYETEVIDVNLPVLFGLDNMKKHQWYVNEVTDEFCSYLDPSLNVKLILKMSHLYLEWPSNLILYSRSDLIKINGRFAHSTPEKLATLLNRAAAQYFEIGTKKLLEDISRRCKACQHMESRLYTFQVTMRDNIQFNHKVIVDISWIEPRPHKPVLHIVHRGTHFSTAKFVSGESAEDAWNTLISCWVSVYAGFPNIMTHDFGICFTSDFFRMHVPNLVLSQKKYPVDHTNPWDQGKDTTLRFVEFTKN